MEDSREIQFRKIQKIVDACIQHDYKTVIDAFSLKKEYLNESQLKDYDRLIVLCVLFIQIWSFMISYGKATSLKT